MIQFFQAYKSLKPISNEKQWLPYYGTTIDQIKAQVREKELDWNGIFVIERTFEELMTRRRELWELKSQIQAKNREKLNEEYQVLLLLTGLYKKMNIDNIVV